MKLEGTLLHLFLPQSKGACLAHFRNLLQIRQIELSRELGISRSSISKMEIGDLQVSEIVWHHILRLVYKNFTLNQKITFLEFQETVEQYLNNKSQVRVVSKVL